MNVRERKIFAMLLVLFMQHRMLAVAPLPYFFGNEQDFVFLLLMNLFHQYVLTRRRPLPHYNLSIRNRILDNIDSENFAVNDVYSLIVGRSYEFWLLSGETPVSFDNLRQLLHMTHINRTVTVNNMILMTLIWLRQYPTYSLISLSFGVSIPTVSRIINQTWIKLWEVCAPMVRWPTNQEWLNKRGKWIEMPDVVGMIDGTSHEILVPLNEPQQDFYSGHRKYHCIHTQVIVDNDKNICLVQSGFLGHENDANAFHQIDPIGLGQPLDFPQNCVLLADSIYPNVYPLVTPYKSNEIRNQPRNERRRRRKVNSLHRRRRVYVEHVINEIKTFRVIGSLHIYRHSRWHMSSLVELCAKLFGETSRSMQYKDPFYIFR